MEKNSLNSPPFLVNIANPCARHPDTSRRGLILSPTADPIPYRLVQRIQSGKFVKTRDILAIMWRIVALHGQLEDCLHGSAHSAAIRGCTASRHMWQYNLETL